MCNVGETRPTRPSDDDDGCQEVKQMSMVKFCYSLMICCMVANENINRAVQL